MERERKEKVTKYKEQKEREKKLRELADVVERDHTDEDVKVVTSQRVTAWYVLSLNWMLFVYREITILL